MKNNKQTEALRKATQNKTRETLSKVSITLNLMKEKNIPINFNSVARLSGVSKTWLYKNEDMKSNIDALRRKSTKIQRAINLEKVVKEQKEQITKLNEKNK